MEEQHEDALSRKKRHASKRRHTAQHATSTGSGTSGAGTAAAVPARHSYVNSSSKRRDLDDKLASRTNSLRSIGSFAAELQKKYGFRVRSSASATSGNKNKAGDGAGADQAKDGDTNEDGTGGTAGGKGRGKAAGKKGKKPEEQAILSRDRHLQISVCLARLPPKDRILADVRECSAVHRLRDVATVRELEARHFASQVKSVRESLLHSGDDSMMSTPTHADEYGGAEATQLPVDQLQVDASARINAILPDEDSWSKISHSTFPVAEQEASAFCAFVRNDVGELGAVAAGVTGYARSVMLLENLPPETRERKHCYQDPVFKELLAIEAAVYECLHSEALQTLLTMVLLLGNYVNYGVDVVDATDATATSSTSSATEVAKTTEAARDSDVDKKTNTSKQEQAETAVAVKTAKDLDAVLYTKSFSVNSLKKLREIKIQGQKGEVDLLTFLVHRLPADLSERLKFELHHVLAVAQSVDFADIREKIKAFHDNLAFADREARKYLETPDAAVYSPPTLAQVSDCVARGEQRRTLLFAMSGYVEFLGKYLVRYFAEEKETCETFLKTLGTFVKEFDAVAKRSKKLHEKRPKAGAAVISRGGSRRGTAGSVGKR
eukprot:g5172.t1